MNTWKGCTCFHITKLAIQSVMNSTNHKPTIKVCGITRVEDARTCAQIGVDAIGILVVRDDEEPSGHRVTIEQAEEIAAMSPLELETVLLVHSPAAEAPIIINRIKPNCIQMQVEYTLEEIDFIRHSCPGIKTIKTLHVYPNSSMSDLKTVARDWVNSKLVDALLFDSKSQTSGRTGGSGRVHDWSLTAESSISGFPSLLAGGLDANNVQTALRTVNPSGVDAMTRLEVSPGIKNFERVQSFVSAVRNIRVARGLGESN